MFFSCNWRAIVLILMLFEVISTFENFTDVISVLEDCIYAPQMDSKYNLEVQVIFSLFTYFEPYQPH